MVRTLIRFSASNHPLSWLVQQRTGCVWSHCDLILPSGKLLGALPGDGVQVRDRIEPETRFAVYEVPVTNGHKYAQQQINRPYDWGAIIGLSCPFPVKRNWRDPHYFYCSELVFMSLESAGLKLFSPDCWGVTPRDLLLSPLLKRVG